MLRRNRTLLLRLAALFVVAVAAVRGAAPLVDGLLHHRGAQEQSRIHLDKPGGCDSHAEHCVVRGQASGLRYATPARITGQRGVRFTRLPADPDRIAPSLGATTTHHSRAPPTPSA